MSTHTPGPWELRQAIRYTFNGARIVSAEGTIVATLTRKADKAIKQKELDGRLIAAAPELLKALRGVLRVADRATDEFDAARAAILKATGASA